MSGDPTPNGITLWTRLTTSSGARHRRARGRARQGLPQGRRVASDVTTTAGRRPRGQGARRRPEARTRTTSTASRPRTTDSPSGASAPRPPPDSNETVRFAFFSCQDYTHGYYNAHARWPARTSTSSSTSATTSTPTASTRSPGRGGDGARPCARDPGRAGPHARATTATSTSSTAPTRTCGRCRRRFAMVIAWDDHEVTDDYAGAPADGGHPARTRLRAQAGATPTGPSSSPCRVLARPAHAAVPHAAVRHATSTCSCSTSASTATPALQRPVGRQPRPVLAAVLLQPQRPADDARRREGGFLDARLAAPTRAGRSSPTRCRSRRSSSFRPSSTPTTGPATRRPATALLLTIQKRPEHDVVFVTGDIHTF